MRKHGVLLAVAVMALSLTACAGGGGSGDSSVKTSRVTKKTVGAIKAGESNVIELAGGKVALTENYRYAMNGVSDNDLVTYFVWNPEKANFIADQRDGRSGDDYENDLKKAWEEAQAKAKENASKNPFTSKQEETTTAGDSEVFVFDKDAYITAYNENITLYVYSGIDRNSPAENLTSTQVKLSLRSYLDKSLGANEQLKNVAYAGSVPDIPSWELIAEESPSHMNPLTNGEYYVGTFTADSGEPISSTYGENFFPKKYFCIYLLEKEKDEAGSVRRWYGFVLTNDGVGDYMDEEMHKDFYGMLTDEFGITLYPTEIWDTSFYVYDEGKDYRNGLSYEQFEALFDGVKQYYLIFNTKKTEIDNGVPTTPPPEK